jgi:protein-histidine pros-kinase
MARRELTGDVASPRTVRRLERAGAVLAGVVGATAATVLVVGWGLGVARVTILGVGLAPMKANAALCFLLEAGALWLCAHPGAPIARRRVAAVLAAAAVAIAAVTVSQDVFGWSIGIDDLVAADPSSILAPGRMSPATAMSFLCLGAALLLLGRGTAQALSLFAAATGFLAVVGHVYDVRDLYALPGFSTMTLPTALALVVLAVGVWCVRPELAAMRTIIADTPGGTLVRRLLPGMILAPIVIGWVLLRGEQLGLFPTAMGVALVALSTTILLGGFTWLTAGSLLRAELANRRGVAALKQSEARKAAILGAAHDCIVSIDEHGIVTDLNPAAERTFGHARAQALGRPVEDLIIPERLRDAHRAGIARYLATGEARIVDRRVELPALRADGTELPVELTILAVKDGGRTAFTAFLRDLSDAKRAEALAAENRTIAEANRMKSEFLSAMSHELRTPLNTIIGFTELLYDGKVGPVTPDQHEFLGDVLTSSRHLVRLINDILDLAKVEAGKLEFRPEPVVLARVVGEVVTTLRPGAAAKRIDVATELDPAMATVTLDGLRLKQVLYNYLSNALKFTGEGGRVVVRTRVEGAGEFRVEVEDNGAGIPAEHLGKLFRRFQQLQHDGAGWTGTGLGLALTKALVEAQGGRVGVRSEPGHGSTFHAVLPRHTGSGSPAA